MSEDRRAAVEPWQVLVKASEAGLVVMNTHEGEDIAGLHVSGHFFGRMAEWEKFTSSGYTTEQVEAAVRRVIGKWFDAELSGTAADIEEIVANLKATLANGNTHA